MSTITTTGAAELGRLGEQAEDAVRALAHLTRPGLGALSDPADAAKLIAALARATAGLPQVTAQLTSWLVSEGEAGRLRLDGCSPSPDPAVAVTEVTAALGQAARCGHAASRALDAAHQAVARLASGPEGRA